MDITSSNTVLIGYSDWPPSRGLRSECQNFPGNKIPGQKISRRNVPGQENSGTRKFQEFHFFPEFEKYIFEKIPRFFFCQSTKFQDF